MNLMPLFIATIKSFQKWNSHLVIDKYGPLPFTESLMRNERQPALFTICLNKCIMVLSVFLDLDLRKLFIGKNIFSLGGFICF